MFDDFLDLFLLLFFEGLEAVLGVVYKAGEDEVELGVAAGDVVGGDDGGDSELFGIANDFVSSCLLVVAKSGFIEGVVELVEEDGVVDAVLGN